MKKITILLCVAIGIAEFAILCLFTHCEIPDNKPLINTTGFFDSDM
jgi:hypothetical protein